MVKNFFRKLPKIITDNFIWKLLSVLIAFFFWWAVVSYDDPVKEVTFDNIPVAKVNVESVTDNNYAIEYLEGEYVDVTIKAKRSVVDKLTDDDIYAYADISNMSITNAVDIEAEIDAEYQSMTIYPANMKVQIENIISENKEVQYYFEGEPEETYIALDPIITPSVIQVTGPESQLGLLSSVVVPIPIDGATQDVTLYYTPDLLDSQNSTVGKLELNVEEVAVTVPIQQTKTVDIRFLAYDTVQEGYRLMDVSLDSASTVIRGKSEDIDGIDEIVINDVSLYSMTFDTTVEVFLEDYLPDNVHVYSPVKDAVVNIEVEPIVEKTIEFDIEDIDIRNIPEDAIFKYGNLRTLSVIIKGINDELDEINIETLNPYINLLDLEPGTHEVVVSFYVPYRVEMISEDQFVEVIIEKERAINEVVEPGGE